MIWIKSPKELELMRESGRISRIVREELVKMVRPGVNELDLDAAAARIAREHGALCSTKGYRGFPSHVCISVNDKVVHGIPQNRTFQEGDVVGIDLCITYQRLITDSAVTVPVGKVSKEVHHFLQTASGALEDVLKIIKAGIHVGDIGAFIQERVEGEGYSVVQELTGHGVGRKLHEDPHVPNFGTPGTGPILESGMTLAIEPIITMGKRHVGTDTDGWTIRTRDGSLACQFEHSIIVHDDYAEVIT